MVLKANVLRHAYKRIVILIIFFFIVLKFSFLLSQVAKDNLQLVGAAALLLASKVEELMPPLVSDFVYVCDDAYTRETILAMERKMLKVMELKIMMQVMGSNLRLI